MFGVFERDLFGVVVLSSGDDVFVASFVFVNIFDFGELGFGICCDTKFSSAVHCSNNRSRHIPRNNQRALFQVVVDVN